VPQLQQPLHDPLRRRRGRLLADTGLRPDLVALHRRRRHVLHLRHHRPRPRHHADRRQRGLPGQPHRDQHRRRRHPDGEGLAEPAGLRQHRLRLFLLHHPHRDPGKPNCSVLFNSFRPLLCS
jgi:PAS domain-containing protein